MMKYKHFFFILFAILLLAACGHAALPSSSAATKHEKGPESTSSLPLSPVISDKRISADRFNLSRNFLLSETGIYSYIHNEKGTFILYCDKQSDQFVKLCGRTDCSHSDRNCDAFLDCAIPQWGYYKGKIYFVKTGQIRVNGDAGNASYYGMQPAELWQMDPDGRNKRLVTLCWEKGENVTGYVIQAYANGYAEGLFVKTDENGSVVNSRRYTSLDHPGIFTETAGSERFTTAEDFISGSVLGSDGDIIIIQDYTEKKNPYDDGDKRTYFSLYAWDPAENSIEYIGDCPYTCGYFGRNTAFIVEDGVVKQWNYQSYTGTALFDTGSRTQMALSAFPDFLAVYDVYTYQDLKEMPAGGIPVATIRFYDWNYHFLGECSLTFDKEQLQYGNYIFGETEDRILLVKYAGATKPDYYINKSDFGSGTITLHEYHFPEINP